jgi:hypothetical protein
MLVTPKTLAAAQHLLTHNGQPVALFTSPAVAANVAHVLNVALETPGSLGDFALGTPPANETRKEVKRK